VDESGHRNGCQAVLLSPPYSKAPEPLFDADLVVSMYEHSLTRPYGGTRSTEQGAYKLRHEVLWPHASPLDIQLATGFISGYLGACEQPKTDSPLECTTIGVIS